MSNERNSHRTVIALFAILIIATVAAFAATVADTRTANNQIPPGTMGLAKPHAPLDRAPGQPLLDN
jgi:hypothetical protein